MKGPFETYDAAKAVVTPGEEIWACDSAKAPDRKGWLVVSKPEADEYIRVSPFKTWVHWETIK